MLKDYKEDFFNDSNIEIFIVFYIMKLKLYICKS